MYFPPNNMKMTHLLQLMTHLLDTCPEPEVYPTCMSIIVTDESYVATCNSFLAIKDLLVGTSF